MSQISRRALLGGGGLTGQVGPTPVGELGVTQELHQRGEVHLHRVTTARRR